MYELKGFDVNLASEEVFGDVNDGVLGKRFENVDDVIRFYNDYAKKIGFSVRIQRRNTLKNDPTIHRDCTLCCSCEGTYRNKTPTTKQREHTRCGCMAKLKTSLKHGMQVVTKFIPEHNHLLVSPDQAHLLRSQRRLSESQILSIVTLHDKNRQRRFSELSPIMQRIISKGSQSRERCILTKTTLLELEKKIEAITLTDDDDDGNAYDVNEISNDDEDELLQDPDENPYDVEEFSTEDEGPEGNALDVVDISNEDELLQDPTNKRRKNETNGVLEKAKRTHTHIGDSASTHTSKFDRNENSGGVDIGPNFCSQPPVPPQGQL